MKIGGKHEAETGSRPKSVSRKDREIMQKYWNHSVVFTDAWDTDTDGQKLPEEELQQGELWAVTFRVGCYIVRCARRIYRGYSCGYNLENEVPADKEEIELIKKDIETGYKGQYSGSLNGSGILCRMADDLYGIDRWDYELGRGLYDTFEISARHISNPGSEYTYICHDVRERGICFRWTETLKSIYTVKEHDKIPDEYASLIVHMCDLHYTFNFDRWHRLEPTGKITIFSESGAYEMMSDDTRFR